MLRIQETYDVPEIIPTVYQKHLKLILRNSWQIQSVDWEMFVFIY